MIKRSEGNSQNPQSHKFKLGVIMARTSLWMSVFVIIANLVFSGIVGANEVNSHGITSFIQQTVNCVLNTIGVGMGVFTLLANRRYKATGITGTAVAGILINSYFIVAFIATSQNYS